MQSHQTNQPSIRRKLKIKLYKILSSLYDRWMDFWCNINTRAY